MNTPRMQKGSLHFTMNDRSEFVCQELAGLSDRFESTWAKEAIQLAIQVHIHVITEAHRIHTDNPEAPYFEQSLSEDEEQAARKKIFEEILSTIQPPDGLFQQFLFWFSEWWYYHPSIMSNFQPYGWSMIYADMKKAVGKYITCALPEQVRDTVADMEVGNTSVGFGHFAILFVDDAASVRRIVTDTQLFEIHDVFGYTYLYILTDGRPMSRSATSRAGGRAFFDGVRLMSHEAFETCAPKTIAMEKGYKVNSTDVTIINGVLYPLVDVDDAVAKTHGAFMGICAFGVKDKLQSIVLGEESSQRLQLLENDMIRLDEKT